MGPCPLCHIFKNHLELDTFKPWLLDPDLLAIFGPVFDTDLEKDILPAFPEAHKLLLECLPSSRGKVYPVHCQFLTDISVGKLE